MKTLSARVSGGISFAVDEARATLVVYKHEKFFLSAPLCVSVNGEAHSLSPQHFDGQTLHCTSPNVSATVRFVHDAVVIAYEQTMAADTPIHEVRCFAGGLGIGHFNRAFTPQPRNNNGNNISYFMELPDCSLKGYYSPSILNFSMAMDNDWVSFGLLDLPDSSQYHMEEDFSLLVESCGGNKVVKRGQTYRMPRVLLTFPVDEWQGIALFREKLLAFGEYTPRKTPLSACPKWWKAPCICTYGDQIVDGQYTPLDDPRFNLGYVREQVRQIEEDWGFTHYNLIIDAFWQVPFALDPRVDMRRFAGLREFIDEMHRKGNRVILWMTPMFDRPDDARPTRTQTLDVLSETELTVQGIAHCRYVDFTADNIREHLRQTAQAFFGHGTGELACDGLKMDYLARQRDPAVHTPYRHPERGLGVRELKRFYEIFYEEIKKVNPEGIVSSSATEPRFEHLMDLHRLHDTHIGNIEKEFRARISTLACPDLPIDSDGCLMSATWYKNHYICASLYALPTNYYTMSYKDRQLTLDEKRAFAALLKLVEHRPDGQPVFDRFGNWRLVNGGRVDATTIDGHTLVFYPNPRNAKGYLFTWQDEAVALPLHGRKFGRLVPDAVRKYYQVDYGRDQAIVRLQPGVVYTFEDIDEGNSHDTLFSRRRRTEKGEISYVNLV